MERKNLFRLSGKILLTVFILILYIKFGIATTGCIQCSSGEVCSGNTGTPDCTVSDSQTVVLGNGLKIFNFGTLTIQNSKILTFERNDEAPEEFGGGSGGAGGAGSGGQAGGTGEDGCNKLKGNTGSYGDEKAGADVKFTANTFNLYGTLKSVGEGGRNGATNPAPPRFSRVGLY